MFNALDVLVIVVTNQRGIGLGLMTEADLAVIHTNMLAELNRQGARIHDILHCPHLANSCDCRKPKPGMIYYARDKWAIDIPGSLMIGDSDSDEALAAACGMHFLRAVNGHLTPLAHT